MRRPPQLGCDAASSEACRVSISPPPRRPRPPGPSPPAAIETGRRYVIAPTEGASSNRVAPAEDADDAQDAAEDAAAARRAVARLRRNLHLAPTHLSEHLAAAALLSESCLPVLTRLCLHENRIGDRGAALLFEAVRRGALPALVRLDLSSNRIGDDGAIALGALLAETQLPSLEELSLAANRQRVLQMRCYCVHGAQFIHERR